MVENEQNNGMKAYATCPNCKVRGPRLMTVCDQCRTPMIPELDEAEQKRFDQARLLLQTCHTIREDLPDGMWEEIRYLRADLPREFAAWTGNDKRTFTQEIDIICEDYGFQGVV